ncbi:hypothetical protein ABT278_24380 [Streptomyces sp. NPDC001228]|uniref:hypothetical protein n=1 Tax=Streptomyces sp. NPDC001228 TaxID=3154381 RepID=UPI003322C343
MRYVRELLAPLGGVVADGATNATGTWSPADVSVGAFLAERRQRWDGLLTALCALCAYDEARAAADATGWFREYELSAPLLVLWSAAVTGPDSFHDPSPAAVRRMCRTAADLQLTEFLDMAVAVALDAGTDAAEGTPRLVEVLTAACDLAADPTGTTTPAHVHRMWRVARLPATLRPTSPLAGPP